MENNKKELTAWAIEHFKEDLKIVEQRWNIFETQPYFDYKVVIKISGNYFEGRGINLSQKSSLNAAIGEAIERFVINLNNIKNSNGCAFHTDSKIAVSNAQSEILERHYVMLFTLGYWNQEKISNLNYPREIINILKTLESKGIQIEFLILKSSADFSIILCQANGLKADKPFGLIFGSSCSPNQEQSIIKSFKEVLVNIVAFLNNNIKSISYEYFLGLKTYTPYNHLELYLDRAFAKKYLDHRKFENNISMSPNLEMFHNNFLQFPYDSQFTVVKSTHPDCLSPTWGPLGDNYSINNKNLNFPFVLP